MKKAVVCQKQIPNLVTLIKRILPEYACALRALDVGIYALFRVHMKELSEKFMLPSNGRRISRLQTVAILLGSGSHMIH